MSHINNFGFIGFLLMFLEEGMIDQLLDAGSIIWIFLQAAVQEISNLGTDEQIGRYFNLIFYDFYQLLFSCYFERIFTDYHLVHHYTNRPNIYLLIVLFPFEDLRTNIEWCAAEGSSEFVILVH